jgi:hypothetical protein
VVLEIYELVVRLWIAALLSVAKVRRQGLMLKVLYSDRLHPYLKLNYFFNWALIGSVRQVSNVSRYNVLCL